MSDAEMMRFMAGCMLAEGPAPSVETPLHSLLPHRVIVHTHDVATMSLTNVPDATAERLVGELFEGTIVYVPYSRPGFPLARAVGRMVGPDPGARDRPALAHHGLVVWGDDADEVDAAAAPGGRRRSTSSSPRDARGRQPLGAVRTPAPAAEERRRLAEIVLPAVRGALSLSRPTYRPTALPPDRSSTTTTRPTSSPTLAAERMPELAGRGMATPEHLLRAGRLPVRLDARPRPPRPTRWSSGSASQIASARQEYEQYHAPPRRGRAAPARRLGQSRSSSPVSASSPRSATSGTP